MKKTLGGVLGALSYLSIPIPAFAQPTPTPVKVNLCPVGQFDPLCKITSGRFGDIISSLITIIFIIAIVVAVIYLLYGAIKWIISAGDKGKVEEARNHIVAAIVGLIIAFVAFFLINVVIGFFIPEVSLTNLQLPTLNPKLTPTP